MSAERTALSVDVIHAGVRHLTTLTEPEAVAALTRAMTSRKHGEYLFLPLESGAYVLIRVHPALDIAIVSPGRGADYRFDGFSGDVNDTADCEVSDDSNAREERSSSLT